MSQLSLSHRGYLGVKIVPLVPRVAAGQQWPLDLTNPTVSLWSLWFQDDQSHQVNLFPLAPVSQWHLASQGPSSVSHHRITEPPRLEKTLESIKSKLRTNITLSSRPWHSVPHPVFPETLPGTVTHSPLFLIFGNHIPPIRNGCSPCPSFCH